jgi:hypothetical protein
MTKRYSTTYSNGHTDSTSSAHEAINFQNYGDGQVFLMAGEKVSPEMFFAGVRASVQSAWDKKAKTHKRVRVLHGSSVAGYVEKWVRK